MNRKCKQWNEVTKYDLLVSLNSRTISQSQKLQWRENLGPLPILCQHLGYALKILVQFQYLPSSILWQKLMHRYQLVSQNQRISWRSEGRLNKVGFSIISPSSYRNNQEDQHLDVALMQTEPQNWYCSNITHKWYSGESQRTRLAETKAIPLKWSNVSFDFSVMKWL